MHKQNCKKAYFFLNRYVLDCVFFNSVFQSNFDNTTFFRCYFDKTLFIRRNDNHAIFNDCSFKNINFQHFIMKTISYNRCKFTNVMFDIENEITEKTFNSGCTFENCICHIVTPSNDNFVPIIKIKKSKLGFNLDELV